jgi:hypothetical protein
MAKTKTVSKLTAEREEQLGRILRQVWSTIQYDIAKAFEENDDPEGFDNQYAVEVAECCVDYIGMYGGTTADQDELCKLSQPAFRRLADKTFREFNPGSSD